MKIEFDAKVRDSGNGVGIEVTIPSWIKHAYKVKKGDTISVEITKTSPKSNEQNSSA